MAAIKTYITDAGLGYNESVNMLRLDKTEDGYNYLIIDSSTNDKNYKVGKVMEFEDLYVWESNYDIKKSELYNTFLFQHFLLCTSMAR